MQISITPLRSSLEPKQSQENGSNFQSVVRKADSLSMMGSPKSVIKGTPKVVMVPVDEDDPFPISRMRFLEQHPEIESDEAKLIPD